jgi:SAM-dependent methyltransferase
VRQQPLLRAGARYSSEARRLALLRSHHEPQSMCMLERLSKISKYGIGARARERKRAEKEKERRTRFYEAGLWEHSEDAARRRYASYDEYVEHQAAKLDKIAHRLREREEEDFAEFRRRFASCTALQGARSVLCLGARLGTEVRALLDLGYFAIGIDLNPGPNNPYVLSGDFHQIVFADDSIDAVYTNALDHVFTLEKVVGEVGRVLRPGGIFVADLVFGFEDGFIPGEYESAMWRDHDVLIEKIRKVGLFSVDEVRDLGRMRRDRWTQVVFRRSA